MASRGDNAPQGTDPTDRDAGGDGAAASDRGDPRSGGGHGEPVSRARRARGGARNGDLYGALDLGTNNCRLLIAHPTHRGFRVIDAFSRLVRLGEGLSRSGRLDDDAMDRAVEALKVCAGKLRRRKVGRFRLIATEACRIAENQQEFTDRVHRRTALRLEIIDRETEAHLAVAGSESLLDHDCASALVFDIGGGSTELMWLSLRDGGYRVRDWISISIGVVTLAERYGGVDVAPDTYELMKQQVVRELLPFERKHRLSEELSRAPFHLLGTSGTVTTIAGVVLGLDRYDRNKVDGCWINDQHIRDVTQSLVDMDFERRAASPCIGRERADLVLAGCAIAEAILSLWPCDRIRVADRGLREGILTMLMKEDGTYGRGRYGYGTRRHGWQRRRRYRRGQKTGAKERAE